MKLLIVFALLGVILAQYGQSPPSYPSAPGPSYPSRPVPPFFPWIPNHHHHRHRHSRSDSRSRSRSHSRSDSREKSKSPTTTNGNIPFPECNDCKKLKKLRDSSIPTLVDAKIAYLHDKKDCLRAVVSCPFDNNNYTLYAGNSITDNEALSTGFFIERTVKCSKSGK